MYVCVHIYTHIHSYTHIYIYIQTYIYYIYIYHRYFRKVVNTTIHYNFFGYLYCYFTLLLPSSVFIYPFLIRAPIFLISPSVFLLLIV